MIKQSAKREQANRAKKGRGKQAFPVVEFEDEMELHSSDMAVSEIEFQMVSNFYTNT